MDEVAVAINSTCKIVVRIVGVRTDAEEGFVVFEVDVVCNLKIGVGEELLLHGSEL